MRIALTADIHLSIKGEHPERYNALENIFEQVEAENIEALFIAGDLFDKDFQNYSEFEKLCKKHSKIQIHVIPGNHDAGIRKESIVGANIYVYTVPTTIEIGSTTVVLVPYKEKTTMGEQIASLREEIRGSDWILIGHGDYYGGLKELNPLEPGTYMPLSRENVLNYAPRAVFLGHIHKPSNWGNVYYTGSPCGLDICETGRRRFLVYDTADESVKPSLAVTDVLYFDESFVIMPVDDELSLLKQEIAKRIEAWNIDASEQSKVLVRVEAIGYAMDRGAILSTLQEGFDGFKYYNNEVPSIDRLSTSIDRQLSAIAERTMKLIDETEWSFGGDEPAKAQLRIKALEVIYGA